MKINRYIYKNKATTKQKTKTNKSKKTPKEYAYPPPLPFLCATFSQGHKLSEPTYNYTEYTCNLTD